MEHVAPATPSPNAGHVARRPAVVATICFILGIAAHARLPDAPLLCIALLVSLLLLAAYFLRSPRIACVLLCGAFSIAGLLTAQLYAFHYPRDDIGQFASDDPRLAQLELRIEHPPRVLSNPFDQRRAVPPKQVLTASVVRVLTWDGWVDASGDLLVQVSQPHPRLAAGQTVRALGMLQRPAPAMNPGQFDWAAYYRDQRILASFTIPHADNIAIVRDDGPGPLVAAREKVRRLLAAGFPAERALDHALLRALLLGDSDPQMRDVQEQFQRTGTSHHLAISGMHIAVLGGFVLLLCRLLCLRPAWSAWIVICFVLFYGLMALPSAPVVRSVVLCMAIGLGYVGKRSPDGINLLAVSGLLMLVYRPLDLYGPGFQLSFGTVLGLMLFSKPMMNFMTSFRDRDIAIAEALKPPTLWRRTVRWTDHAVMTGVAAGLVAWGVSFPLIAYHFEQLNPWAIPAGIILGPVVFAALVCGMLKVVLTLLWPGLSAAWATLASWPVEGMRAVVDFLEKWPAADVATPPPAIWLIAFYYLLLLPALLSDVRPGARWLLRIGRIVACLFMLVLPLQRAVNALTSTGRTRMTILAVGAGQCVVVEPPSGRTMLLDAGSTSLSDLRTKCLGPFLRQAGCTAIDTVVLSHGDFDHISAAGEMVDGYGVREVLTGAQFTRAADASPQVNQLLATLDKLERPPRRLSPGDRSPLGRDTFIEVLWPPAGATAKLSPNDSCLVLRLTHGGRTVLFPGDIENAAMRELLKEPDKLRADVLVAPHHGSSETQTAAFVRAVNPRVILSSNDRTLSGKQRNFEGMIGDRLLYRTNRTGAITLTIEADGSLRVEPRFGEAFVLPPIEESAYEAGVSNQSGG